jgi:hypothetical protein
MNVVIQNLTEQAKTKTAPNLPLSQPTVNNTELGSK